ncbi:hypothetical protein ABZ442_29260 [Streptomyces triculaminicus]|uniref:hypothetical protein n=1 Tax=Streptomyces triculaminicus TaxID=2816232 RepID=UPI00340AE008
MTHNPPPPEPQTPSFTAAQQHTANSTAPLINTCGRGKAARQGVLSALRSDRHPPNHARHSNEDPAPDQPGIRIYAPPVHRSHDDGARWSKRYGATPTAAYACPCGETGTATGEHAVAAMVAEYEVRKLLCTGAPAAPAERRDAA